jgi:dihydroorotase
MPTYDLLLKNGTIINEGMQMQADLAVKDGRIAKISSEIDGQAGREINCEGKWILPGIIDDQVHFREPGLTHKAEIATESKAAVRGGTTTFFEMPNTKPPALTQELLEEKYQRAAQVSPANYSFFMGVSNDNAEEVLKTPAESVCGIKIFMGSSTGNMLVDQRKVLDKLFAEAPVLIATHCEDEQTVRSNLEKAIDEHGDDIPAHLHPEIRSVEACYKSSSFAVELAKEHGTRLHILHLTTAKELDLFDNTIPLEDKRITSEVCVHHLHFCDKDYANLGHLIKCNPAIKSAEDRAALWKALEDDRLDIIATDHAPHTWEEKQKDYVYAPSGLPLVQHGLHLMMNSGILSVEQVVEKMSHSPAICFEIEERGFLREGYWADIVVWDPDIKWTVEKENILYKCGWSPLEGNLIKGDVLSTIVSGHLAYHNNEFDLSKKGRRVTFDR